MGHIYRSLSLAHEITEHEILFVCDTDHTVAVNKLAGYDYWLGIYRNDKVVESIIKGNNITFFPSDDTTKSRIVSLNSIHQIIFDTKTFG